MTGDGPRSEQGSLDARARVLSAGLGAAAALVGAVHLALWFADVPPRWAARGAITLKANMALALVLAGATLVALDSPRAGRRLRAVAVAAAALVLAVGALTLAEHLLGVDLRIDQLIATEPPGAPGTVAPNRMGPPAATALVFVGAGLAALALRRRGSAVLGAAAFFVVLLPTVGWLYGVGPFYSLPRVTGISWPASLALVCLSVGLWATPRVDGRTSLLWRRDPGGVLLRRMLLPAVVVPLLLGYFRLAGERAGLYGSGAGTGLLAVALASIFVLLLWRNAAGLSVEATARARSEEARLESEGRLRAIFDDAAVGIVEVDAGDRFVAVNRRICRMLDYAPEELIGRSLHDLTAPDDRPLTRDLNAKGHSGALSLFEYEKRYLRRDGTPLWVHVTVSVVRDTEGRFLRAIGTVEDIAERRRAEDALRESERRYRTLAENTPEVIARFDRSLRHTYVNAFGATVYGRSPDEVLGKTSAELGLPPETVASWRRQLEDVFATGEQRSAELELGGPPRGPRHFSSLFVPERGAAGEVASVLAITRDVTGYKRAEAALREANERLRDADRRKDEFLGVLSHELRNPLAPIANSLFLLERADPAGPQAARARQVMRRQVAHLARLVDDLLDVTRVARGKIPLHRSDLDLGEVVRRAAEDHRSMLQDAGLALEVHVPDERLVVHADEARLTQIVGNLLQNARRFTREGGSVRVSLAREGDRAAFRVLDTGSGIDADLLPRLFAPFVQAQQSLARTDGGLGLGLALVKGLAELHGGTVRAASAGRDRGSEFTVELPLVAGRAAPGPQRPAAAARASPAREHRRVLVVDDNVDAAGSLAELVRLFGHEVDVAYDGPSAIAKAGANRPGVVLCDLGLPGMSGYEVARTLRNARDHGLKLVAVSGYAQPEDVRRAIEAGFDAHVAKPPDPEQIERLLA